ncbi:tRNA (guanine-N(7)-)-methyltransferase [Buchnera aphidicola (Tetraneura ulmi)]|uniref:tRNA (guanosine(46)-N7)-methyltransferase TrmB n=1 Tax=Buchnera aphidicola TaxID=9 RepID=UPI00346388F2
MENIKENNFLKIQHKSNLNISTSFRYRISSLQRKSIEKYYPLFGLKYQNFSFDWIKIFGRSKPIILEIGFGNGDSLINSAIENPNKNFLGIELYLPGIAIVLQKINDFNLKNIRIIYFNAIDVLMNSISECELSEIRLFFPDPWPKRKHHKRRIVQKQFLKIVYRKLSLKGKLHIITDSESYFLQILKNIKSLNCYIDLSKNRNYLSKIPCGILTKFEKKGIKLGNRIFHLFFLCKK